MNVTTEEALRIADGLAEVVAKSDSTRTHINRAALVLAADALRSLAAKQDTAVRREATLLTVIFNAHTLRNWSALGDLAAKEWPSCLCSFCDEFRALPSISLTRQSTPEEPR